MDTLRLGLIGDNIAGSGSPRLHRLAGAQAGLDVTYELIVPAARGLVFEELLADCARAGLRGVNVTYPYKERAAKMVEIDDAQVRAVGAVNTVIFDEGRMHGFNTDRSGFIAAHRAQRGDALPGTVLMIGTGGVGRAVAFALTELGAPALRLVDRDPARAKALAAELSQIAPDTIVTVHDKAEDAAQGCTGLVNCTPVGMTGYEGTPLDAAAMPGALWAFDAVYTPRDTQFLTDAAEAGLEVISGWDLFFHQGVHAWTIFSGHGLDEGRLRASLSAKGDHA